MYELLNSLLSDKKGGEIFTCFGYAHLLYIAITAAACTGVLLYLRRRSLKVQSTWSDALITVAFSLYLLDFFLMPFAYGEIDIEKLPFHVCTASCVACFLAHRIPALRGFKVSFTLLGFLSNLVYLIYPAGVMWHAVHPLSYRVVQTLVFHAIMTVYGITVLVFEREKLHLRGFYKNAYTVTGMTVWAILGNLAYNGTVGEYDHFFNWFFVVRDPFYLLPETIAPFVMPFVNIGIFLACEAAICGFATLVLRGKGEGKGADAI